MAEHEGNTFNLGGNIRLSGFGELDGANMIVVKKIVGNYARKISESGSEFSELHLTLKVIHKKEKSEKYEIHGKILCKGKVHTSEVTDFNLYFALDNLLKKLHNMIAG